MTTSADPPFRAEIDRQSALFRSALAKCEDSASVPSCPDWTAVDLLGHLTEVQCFWARIVSTPVLTESDLQALGEAERPTTEPLAAFDEAHARLCAAVDASSPAEQRWMWTADEHLHTTGYITRRQAHEALIHRVDAELTAAQAVSDTNPALAADGVDEMITVMLGGHPEWATFAPDGRVVRFAATDTGDEWLVQLGRLSGTHPQSGESFEEASLQPVAAGDPIATVSGPSWPLDLWLWNRGDAERLERTGDRDALRHVDEALAEGLS